MGRLRRLQKSTGRLYVVFVVVRCCLLVGTEWRCRPHLRQLSQSYVYIYLLVTRAVVTIQSAADKVHVVVPDAESVEQVGGAGSSGGHERCLEKLTYFEGEKKTKETLRKAALWTSLRLKATLSTSAMFDWSSISSMFNWDPYFWTKTNNLAVIWKIWQSQMQLVQQ